MPSSVCTHNRLVHFGRNDEVDALVALIQFQHSFQTQSLRPPVNHDGSCNMNHMHGSMDRDFYFEARNTQLIKQPLFKKV